MRKNCAGSSLNDSPIVTDGGNIFVAAGFGSVVFNRSHRIC